MKHYVGIAGFSPKTFLAKRLCVFDLTDFTKIFVSSFFRYSIETDKAFHY